MVEVQKTEDFLRFLLAARDPLRRFAWSRFKKLWTFYDFCGTRATLCGDSRGRGSKTVDFFARDPLRRFAWSRFKDCGLFTISACRARPSAEIRVVEVQNCGLFTISAAHARPSAQIVRVEALSLLAKRPLEVVLVCAPAFAIPRSRVRFPPGPRQLRLENRSF